MLHQSLEPVRPKPRFRHLKSGAGGLRFLDTFAPPGDGHPQIEARAHQTAELGRLPLWEGFADVPDYPRRTSGGRSSAQVSVDPETGAFFVWLVEQLTPGLIVEFGGAFGVSGMYWLEGIERAGAGHLHSYEPNKIWAAIAEGNLRAVSHRFDLTRAPFETSAARTLTAASVGLAFIDAIHTSDFVNAQFATLRPYLAPGAIVLFDDIGFSPDMKKCWRSIALGDSVACSAQLGRRIGVARMPNTKGSSV